MFIVFGAQYSILSNILSFFVFLMLVIVLQLINKKNCHKKKKKKKKKDIVDKKDNTGTKLPTRDVSVLSRLPIIRPESAKVIGSNEALSSGVKDPFQ